MKNFKSICISAIILGGLALTSCDTTSVSPDGNSSNSTLFANASAGDGVKVSASDLPATIIIYLNANYSGKTIVKAEKYSNKYEVVLSDATKIEFSLAGTFIEVSKGVGVSDDPKAVLPQLAVTYIANNYPGATIVKSEKELTKYEVTLSNGYKLEFTLTGVFKKAKFVGKKKG
jgi:hypothetical protein